LNVAGAVTDATGHYSSIGLAAGAYSVTASATGFPDSTVNNATVTADSWTTINIQMGGSGGGGFTPIRVNAGGSSYTDSLGQVWSGDTGYLGGNTYSTAASIGGTTAAALYQTERYNTGPVEYLFTAPNGSYNVKLKFAEIYFTQAGQRSFNIVINGQTVQTSLYAFAQAGGGNLAVDRTYPVTVSAGQIDIKLVPVISNPKISAIEIN